MGRRLLAAWAGAAILLSSGCTATGPLLDNPILLQPQPGPVVENPLWVPLGAYESSYPVVWRKVLSVLGDYFVIATTNRFDGRIVTHPRIAPGYEQFFKPGSPDHHERTLATLQTIRQYAIVRVTPDRGGGFWVDVKVFKELEDLPRPTRETAGAATFRSDNSVERQYEVIDPAFTESNWIPVGQDESLEQEILLRLKECL